MPYVPQPIDSNDVLILHCDGPDASTTFGDSSQYGKTVTAGGNAKVTTAQSKFSGASAVFVALGDRLSIPDSADFEFGTGDFTFDFWMRPNIITGTGIVIAKRTIASSNYGPWLFYRNTSALQMYMSSTGASYDLNGGVSWGATLVAGTWTHIALVRSGTTFYGFQDGVQKFTFTSSLAPVDNASALTVSAASGESEFYNGWIDELRISKGVARWTANFSVPDMPYAPALTPDLGMAITVT